MVLCSLKHLSYILPLAFLWWRLIDHLHVEWSVNPQYAYGWAVPFLCLYLLWERLRRDHKTTRPRDHETTRPAVLWSSGPVVSLSLLALLYAPIRLVQEANPEWRLISWALALVVVGLTLLTLRTTLGAPRAAQLAFPLCFFLVAVPWPTPVEQRLVQGLTQANAALTVECMGWFGVPAIQHGNVIEIGSGVLGIDEACSGIRSFQASLMISLFFGELYRLSILRRIGLCVLGFGLSFLFNAIRTSVLVAVASAKGIDAVSEWHDPAGLLILLACFVSLWGISAVMARAREHGPRTTDYGPQDHKTTGPPDNETTDETTGQQDNETTRLQDNKTTNETTGQQDYKTTSGPVVRSPVVTKLAFALIAWIVLVEIGVEAWYRRSESHLPASAAWSVNVPRDASAFRELPIAEKARQILRYDEGLNVSWQDEAGLRWQMIFLRWLPGRTAVHLARNHTPEICLTAAGGKLEASSDLKPFPTHGLELPFRTYTFREQGRPVYVFYSLWDDRATVQQFETMSLTYANRLGPVLAGQRNRGQRSLELVLWGMADATEAEAALRRQLEKLVR